MYVKSQFKLGKSLHFSLDPLGSTLRLPPPFWQARARTTYRRTDGKMLLIWSMSGGVANAGQPLVTT